MSWGKRERRGSERADSNIKLSSTIFFHVLTRTSSWGLSPPRCHRAHLFFTLSYLAANFRLYLVTSSSQRLFLVSNLAFTTFWFHFHSAISTRCRFYCWYVSIFSFCVPGYFTVNKIAWLEVELIYYDIVVKIFGTRAHNSISNCYIAIREYVK